MVASGELPPPAGFHLAVDLHFTELNPLFRFTSREHPAFPFQVLIKLHQCRSMA